MRYLALSLLMVVAACAQAHNASEDPTETHPFVGCWQSDDGLSIEGWTQDPSGWLFGYAVNRDENNKVKFFEQMRFDGEYLTVIGPNDDPTPFRMVKSGPDYIFENPEHDYPQRITYSPTAKGLDANISRLDGSDRVDFSKTPCPSSSK